MSFLNGKIAKIAVFTIPINNGPDEHVRDLISGNSLDELENVAEQLRSDYERKNSDIKDPDKPVRVVLEDTDGQSYIENVKGKWRFLTQEIKKAFTDENDETGTPSTTTA